MSRFSKIMVRRVHPTAWRILVFMAHLSAMQGYGQGWFQMIGEVNMHRLQQHPTSATTTPESGRDIAFSWWARGGEPGPGYTSDKIEIRAAENAIHGSYIRARFNDDYEPPFLSEEFSALIPQSLWQRLRSALSQDNPFGIHLPSEDRGNVADILKETISLSIGGHVTEKTVFGSGPEELPSLKSARNEVAQYLVDNGTRRIRSQRKR